MKRFPENPGDAASYLIFRLLQLRGARVHQLCGLPDPRRRLRARQLDLLLHRLEALAESGGLNR